MLYRSEYPKRNSSLTSKIIGVATIRPNGVALVPRLNLVLLIDLSEQRLLSLGFSIQSLEQAERPPSSSLALKEYPREVVELESEKTKYEVCGRQEIARNHLLGIPR